MAYIAGRSRAVYVLGEGSALDVPLPPHVANDVLYLAVQQDGGTGTISVSGWTEVTTQAAHSGQRTAVFRKVASSSSTATPTVTFTLDDDAGASVIVVRGANTTAPEHQSTRSNVSSDATPAAGSVTTSQTNCLILWFFGYDNGLWRLTPMDLAAIQYGDAVTHSAGCLAVGWTNKLTAGATPTPEMQHGANTVGGTIVTIAVADDGNGHMGPMLSGGATWWKRFTHDNHIFDGTTFDVPSALAASTSIGGIDLDTTDTINGTELVGPPDAPYDTFTSATNNNAYGAGVSKFAGVSFAVSSIDISNKLVGLRFAPTTSAATFADPGFVIVFQDASNNWKAIQIAKLASVLPLASDARLMVLDPAGATAFASSGTINWATISRVGILFVRKTTSTATRLLAFRHLMLFTRPTFVGGSAGQPLRGSLLKDMLCGWLQDPYITVQGERQTMSRVPIQFGDGSTPTYVDTAGMSLEPHPTRDESYERAAWVMDADDFEFRIKASASDTMYLRSAVIGAGQRQRFIIDPASSASADYDFSGLVLVRFYVENDASGVVMNGVTFSRPDGISLDGGILDGCVIDGSTATAAVTTNDPENIIDCSFVSSGTGHAIEITTPGTYTFSGNTFSGYGSAGSTDAAIYNNSGGAVTLNITGGGGTPTVRNGAGASTTIVSGVALTFDGAVAGSEIRCYKNSDGTEVFGTESCSANHVFSGVTATGVACTVRIINVAYKIKEFQLTIPLADASVPVQMELDPWYSNP